MGPWARSPFLITESIQEGDVRHRPEIHTPRRTFFHGPWTGGQESEELIELMVPPGGEVTAGFFPTLCNWPQRSFFVLPR